MDTMLAASSSGSSKHDTAIDLRFFAPLVRLFAPLLRRFAPPGFILILVTKASKSYGNRAKLFVRLATERCPRPIETSHQPGSRPIQETSASAIHHWWKDSCVAWQVAGSAVAGAVEGFRLGLRDLPGFE